MTDEPTDTDADADATPDDQPDTVSVAEPSSVPREQLLIPDSPTVVELDTGSMVGLTPADQLGPARAIAAQVALSRVIRFNPQDSDRDMADVAADAEAAERAIIEFLELCIDDGITTSTLDDLRPVNLARLLEAALPEGTETN